MKQVWDFDKVVKQCDSIIERIEEFNADELVAVIRGGMTPAHIIAKRMNLPVATFNPATREFSSTQSMTRRAIFIEDLIAEGRTFRDTAHYFSYAYPCIHFLWAPLVIDSTYLIGDHRIIQTPETVQKDWIVFPWDCDESANEGDRGLFRDGTDKQTTGKVLTPA